MTLFFKKNKKLLGIIFMAAFFSSCLKDFNQPVTADFTATSEPTPVRAFVFQSTGNEAKTGFSEKWYFGDGDSSINDLQPLHQYQSVGNFTATHVVFSNFGMAKSSQTIHVQ